VSSRGLEAIDRVVDAGGDADDVLRALVAALVGEPGIAWAGILFMEAGVPVLGPEAGVADPSRRVAVPIAYQGAVVGELAIDGDAEPAFLAHVARRISTYVLLGWDTRGEAWDC
jgi:hypothetical protein